MCLIPKSGFQSFFKVLTQISPCCETLGWKILVKKKPFGGPEGKSFPNTNFTLKCPHAQGVPAEEEKKYN